MGLIKVKVTLFKKKEEVTWSISPTEIDFEETRRSKRGESFYYSIYFVQLNESLKVIQDNR